MVNVNVFNPSGASLDVFMSRYAAPGENTWLQMAKRVSDHVLPQACDAITEAAFVPAGRTLHGAGRKDWKGGLINCYGFAPEDNVESIGDMHKEMYMTACYGGGTGYNPSNIRPRGSHIGSHYCAAPGVVSLALSIDGMLNQVRSGGSRRAAILGALQIRHPDILEWIRVKQTLGVLENHNISVYINDAFISAVRNDEPWVFSFKGVPWKTFEVAQNEDSRFLVNALDEQHCLAILKNYYTKTGKENFRIVKEFQISAKWLWKKLIKSNLMCGEPGLLNESAIRRDYAVEYCEPWACQNPCTEAVFGHHGNCTLGSMNLSKYASNGVFEWDAFKRDIHIGVRFLDQVLDKNVYPVPEQRAAAMQTRRIGLGVMGYAHMLIEMGMRYGSKDALKFTGKLAEFMRNEAFRASIQLAKELGPCPAVPGSGTPEHASWTSQYLSCDFQKRLPQDIRTEIALGGIRNSVLLSIAPTGTIGTVCNTSTSIEPIFAPAFERRVKVGEGYQTFSILDPKFEEMVKAGRDASLCVGAYDVTPEQHMQTITTWQRYVDQSISKTINCPAGMDYDGFADTLLDYVSDIKGVSIYVDGSRGDSPLRAVPITEAIKMAGGNIAVQQIVAPCATGACEV